MNLQKESYTTARSEASSERYFRSAYQQGRSFSAYFDSDYKSKIACLELDFIAGLPVCGSRLLDVGAGAGVFAEVAADAGWSVTAVDPALEAERLKNNPRITLICGTIDDMPDVGLFDIVTMWDVIEHATAPAALVANAARLLEPDGWLVIETGNYKCADRVLGGRDYWQYQLDHRWYFAPDSLHKLLEAEGFDDVLKCDRVLRPGWQGMPTYTGPLRRQTLQRVLCQPWRVRRHIATHRELVRANTWPLAGIAIVTIAARRSSQR